MPNTRNLTEGGDADVQEESQADRHSDRAGGGAGDGIGGAGVTQSSFSRQTLINALNNGINILTASVGDPLNLEATAFFSFARATSAYIPPHPSSWSAQLFKDFVRGKVEAISLGAIYVAEDITGVIAKGLYRIKTLNRETAILIDQNGNTVLTRRIR